MPLVAKHPEIAARLRTDILRGSYPANRLPNNKELAARYAVAPVTMRKAIRALVQNGLIEARAGSGTYLSERALEHRRGVLVAGIVMWDLFSLEHPHFRKIVAGIAEILNPQAGYNVQLIPVPEAGPGRDGSLCRLRDAVEKRGLDALAISAMLSEEEVAGLWATGAPLALVGRVYPGGYPSVRQDAESGSEMIVEEILRRGCRCAGVLRTRIDRMAVEMGEDLFERVFSKLAGTGVEAGYRYLSAPEGEEADEKAGYDRCRALLQAHPQIDCLVAAGRSSALGARRRLSETGRLPSDSFTLIAVTDEEDMGDFPTLCPALADLGRAVGRLLVAQIENGRESVPPRVRTPMRWLKR